MDVIERGVNSRFRRPSFPKKGHHLDRQPFWPHLPAMGGPPAMAGKGKGSKAHAWGIWDELPALGGLVSRAHVESARRLEGADRLNPQWRNEIEDRRE